MHVARVAPLGSWGIVPDPGALMNSLLMQRREEGVGRMPKDKHTLWMPSDESKLSTLLCPEYEYVCAHVHVHVSVHMHVHVCVRPRVHVCVYGWPSTQLGICSVLEWYKSDVFVRAHTLNVNSVLPRVVECDLIPSQC